MNEIAFMISQKMFPLYFTADYSIEIKRMILSLNVIIIRNISLSNESIFYHVI